MGSVDGLEGNIFYLIFMQMPVHAFCTIFIAP